MNLTPPPLRLSKQLALSSDSGATWSPHSGAPDGVAGGKVAISADGTSILWRTGTNRILVSGTTAAFTDVSSLPGGGSIIAADKKDAGIFYGASGSSFYISRNAGRTFSSSGTLGSSYSPYKIVTHPTVAGDVWVSTNAGLFHSTNFGATFEAISDVSQAWGIALGAPSGSGQYPAIFAVAKISGTGGIYRSDDAGVSSLSPRGILLSNTLLRLRGSRLMIPSTASRGTALQSSLLIQGSMAGRSRPSFGTAPF